MTESPAVHSDVWFNAGSGAAGAVAVVVYQLCRILPAIDSELFSPNRQWTIRLDWPLVVVALRTILGMLGAALVTAGMIRPADFAGAFVSGLTWSTTIEQFFTGRKKTT
ncbi:MAG: hypothetical protein JSR48_03710 [Verrucomicrobia bacterium]|nr:hypothetical protein [Verrucomicrobiota bacterium]